MGLFTAANAAQNKVSFIKNLYKILIILFIIGVLLLAIKLSFDKKDPNEGLKFIGNLLLYPTMQMQSSAKTLGESPVMWQNTNDLGKDLLFNFSIYDTLIMSILTIGFIFLIIFFIVHKMVENEFASILVSIFVFFAIEMLAIAVIKKDNPFLPFYAIVDLGKFLWHDFQLVYSKIQGSALT
jgi:hypothetical protein